MTTMQWYRWGHSFVLACLVSGCPSSRDTVTLTLLTDFEPGEQFASARYAFDLEDTGRPTGTLDASRFSAGANLWSATSGPRPFSPRRQSYRVELVDAEGTVIATASAANSFAGSGAQSVTLTLTRSDCESVLGCADDETCLCGGCYPLACRTDASATGCPGRCCERTGAGTCDAPIAECAEAVCVEVPSSPEEPRCVWVSRDDGCATDEWCDAVSGCAPRTYTPDARDAGVPDARGPIGPDSDGDGSPDALDCNDDDDRVYPGAVDACGDSFDSDCVPGEPACPETEPDNDLIGTPGECAARCCDGTLVPSIQATDEGDCVRESSPLCSAHGYVLRARWNGDVVYRRDRYCWALCCNRESYQRILGVSQGCAEEAAAYCAESDRGGLEDAAWAQCTPSPGARDVPCPATP